MRVGLAGSVSSSRRTLSGLLRHGAEIAGVLGLSESKAAGVSGYCRLDDLASAAGAEYYDFERINDPAVLQIVRGWDLDVFFVVGLSQIVKGELLRVPRAGCVGFHPTKLPEGRGRAPIAWLILLGLDGAATFFNMDEEADSGGIFTQKSFTVSEDDYAADVLVRMEDAIDGALDDWLPKLLAGEWSPLPQDVNAATYFGRRVPTDGLIRWDEPAQRIARLVRASSRPHPGAYTFVGSKRLRIWRATAMDDAKYFGVPGRIAKIVQDGPLVHTGSGLLLLEDFEFDESDTRISIREGVSLGHRDDLGSLS